MHSIFSRYGFAVLVWAAVLSVFDAQASFAATTHAKKSTDQSVKETNSGPMKSATFSGLKLRSIGPAMISGRIADLAVNPRDKSTWYVAAASGGLWKTINAGSTWTPVFDHEGSYSLGCVTIDPNNPLVVWIGTGENNSQRSVSYGDGVYKSIDGGTTWTNMGLKHSEHVSMIAVDPRDSNVVWVAAQGPLWSAGGDRGLFVTRDGGKSWKKAFETSQNTGVTQVMLDPRDPDVMFASTYQRRRHVWGVIPGGPETGLRKSTDGGKTWRKITNGLPKTDMGRIGLAISPVDPDTVYAVLDAQDKKGGFYRSTDSGENWKKRSSYQPSTSQYYMELFADPTDLDRVYAMDTFMHVSDDGGKTFHRVDEKHKHVDNHVLWIDPANNKHLLAGCDGGVYQSFDRGTTWIWSQNLPLSQFYNVAVDNALPFYNIYGGTQDNNSVGGPSQTRSNNGIVNSDWFITQEGDGFHSVVDPDDPDIVYAESQYGVLARFDRKTGVGTDIQPQPGANEPPLRWNWNSPVIVSTHDHKRLYFAAQRVFRSDDRGDSWTPVSPDLTRQIDRNKLKIMGRVWSVDAVGKNSSTSFYGSIVTLAESPVKQGLLAVGTDDGLIRISSDGGANWSRIERFPGVPDTTYVSRVVFSSHDAHTIYATFDNHKRGDFKPYVLRSTDLGKSWTSITGNLPQRGSTFVIAEDPGDAGLLFVGTEFGLFFSPDSGKRWVQLKSGLPVIAIRDLAIQQRENDLVAASFGRGFYVLDDYTPLRFVNDQSLAQEAVLFPARKARTFTRSSPFGGKGQGTNGDQFYSAPNPPLGAVFTYYLKHELKSPAERRRDAEKKIEKQGGDATYPTWSQLRSEDRAEAPAVVLIVSDEDGNVVRRVVGTTKAGIQRVTWDLRYPPAEPTSLKKVERAPWDPEPVGPLVAPGTYKVALAEQVDDKLVPMGAAQTFQAVPLGNETLPPADRVKLVAFEKQTGSLQRAALGAVRAADEAQTHIDYLKQALLDTPRASPALRENLRSIELRLKDIQVALSGDSTIALRNEPAPPSIVDRINQIVYGSWYTTEGSTQTHRKNYEIAAAQFAPVLAHLRSLILVDLARVESAAEAAGAPWTPGRVPEWKP
ncbi:MAG: hypothetical protein WBV39_11555 [Rudaea sp.]